MTIGEWGWLANGLHWSSIDEELCARDDYFFSLLQPALHRVIIANRVTKSYRALLCDHASVHFGCNVNERLSSDAGDCQHWNSWHGTGAPDHSRLHQLFGTKTVKRAVDRRLSQNTLDRVVNLLRDEVNLGVLDHLS